MAWSVLTQNTSYSLLAMAHLQQTSNPEQYLQEIPGTLMVEAHSLYMHKYTSIIEGALYHLLLVHTHTYTPSLFPPIFKIIVNNFARLNKKTERSLGTRLYIPTPTHTYTHTHAYTQTHTNHTCSVHQIALQIREITIPENKCSFFTVQCPYYKGSTIGGFVFMINVLRIIKINYK